jgi:two-component system, LytTR family, sensor kinase
MKTLIYILKILFYLGGILTLVAYFSFGRDWDLLHFFKMWLMNGSGGVLLWVGNIFLADWLNKHFPWTKDSSKRFLITVLATVTYTFVAWMAIVCLWVLLFRDHFDLAYLVQNIDWGSFLNTLIITSLISAVMHGRTFLDSLKISLVEAERLKKEQMAARYEALRNQVNPHFLFNNLNVLATLVHKDADLSERFIKQMAAVYRYVLESREQELVPLDQELKQLERYVFLMRIRFGASLNIHIDPQLALIQHKGVAPLTLQMLVENALKHNEASKSNPLLISISYCPDDYVQVQNRLQAKGQVTESTGIGLDNISARYQFLSEKPVLIERIEPFFTVKVPLVGV